MPDPWDDRARPLPAGEADPCVDIPDAPTPEPWAPLAGARLRVGRKVPTHLYLVTDDNPTGRAVGVVYHSPELAALVVDAVNDYLIAVDRRRETEEIEHG